MKRDRFTVYIDHDVMAWIDGSQNRFGRSTSQRVRTLLRAGMGALSRENPDVTTSGPQMDPPGYQTELLQRSTASLVRELETLREKQRLEKERLNRLLERLTRAEGRLSAMKHNNVSDEKE